MSLSHQPVMLGQVVDILTKDGSQGGVFVDATLGGGGHSEALLNRRQDIQIIGLDQDLQVIRAAVEKLKIFGERFHVIHTSFRRLHEHLGGQRVQGVLMDLGVSSYQLDSAERGFSFQREGPLDMRMDLSQELTAAEVVNHWKEEELARIFWEFGEERCSRRIAKKIIETRAHRPFRTTQELAELVIRVVRQPRWRTRIHPATRVFQALRMVVNDELVALKEGLIGAWQCIEQGGRLVVISFHSLEDRVVKHQFRKWAKEEMQGKLLTHKPQRPSEKEIEENPRARSAKLRAVEKQ